MDDEEAVKAPVTRLRRRLSVEQSDDAKSSSAPNTPTKKRGGRKAAKPELDLINENGIESSTPKNLTKKSNMIEIETDEKPVTPSRRSARIRSNTSLVLEKTISTDSPRSKRAAARRTSQVGSDNEAQLTPARQTRLTKKDSTNADKAEPQPTTKHAFIEVEVIVEEPETPLQKSQSIAEKDIARNQSPTTLRKSPRLSLKNNKHNDSMEDVKKQDNSNNINQKNNDSIKTSENDINTPEDQNNSNKENIATDIEVSQNVLPCTQDNDVLESKRLSITSTELLKELNSEPNKKNKNLNKSSSPIKDTQSQHRRHSTKTLTNLSSPVENDDKCYSDSEILKKKKHLRKTSNNSKAENLSTNPENIEDKLNFSSSKKKKSTNDIYTIKTESNSAASPNRKEKLLSPAANNSNNPSIIDLFNKKPANDMQILMFIEESQSDSNPEKNTTFKQVEDEDQCVPIAQTHFVRQDTQSQAEINEHIFNFNQENKESYAINKSVNKNDSCEPMDVDETIPDDVIVNISVSQTLDISENKATLKEKDKINCSVNEKDVNSRSLLPINSLDKTANENKSTLVLSQLKDISNENNESQSPQSVSKKKLPISLNVTQDSEIDKKNLTNNYSTSTPLQQKGSLKHVVQVNTSEINSNNNSKIDKSFDNSKLNKSNANISKSSEQSESDNGSSKEENSYVNDKAEEANDDYESGDSKDEDEEKYERENEIVEKGETLTSEDEISNDTDYEKDSFIVCSDVQDEDLLDGSGDDLSMSDNELKMTAKSKKKYDERKMKEQKMASRQMFESRHNLLKKSNKSEKTKVIKKRAILYSSDSEDEDIHVRKNKRIRLDSSEVSTNISLDNNFQNRITKSLSKSLISEGQNRSQNEIINTSIQFVDPAHSEKRNGDGDKTQVNVTHVNDPLDDEHSLTSCSSDNVHIKNYDSILNDLNKNIKTKKDKKGDISLNLDKKIKKKSVPIVDQLNLTKIKTNDLINKSVSNKVDNTDRSDESSEEEITSKSVIDKSNPSLSKTRDKRGESETPEDEETITKTNKSLNDKFNQSSKKRLCNKPDDNESLEDEVTMRKNNISLNDLLNQPLSKRRASNKHGNNVSSGDEVITQKNSEVLNKKSKKNVSNNDSSDKNSDNGSSASIDLHLLFSEDSNNSEDVHVTDKKSDVSKDDNNFIPLRKSQGKTDILEMSGFKDASQSESAKKKKKKQTKNMDKSANENPNFFDSTEVQFFVDTTGTHCSKDVDNFLDTSMSSISKRKKGKSLVFDDADKKSDSDAPTEVSNKSIIEAQEIPVIGQVMDSSLAAANKSMNKTPKSDKKKKRMSEFETILQTDDTESSAKKRNSKKLDAGDNTVSKLNLSGTVKESMNKSVTKTPKSEKKKTKRMSESQREDKNSDSDAPMEVSNKSMIEEQENPVIGEVMDSSLAAANKSMNKTPKSDKKKKRISEFETILQTDDKEISAKKRNSKKLDAGDDTVSKLNLSGTVKESMNKSVTKTPKSEKKKTKRMSESQQEDKNSDSDAPMEVSNKSMIEEQEIPVIGEVMDSSLAAANKSMNKTPKSDKKKKRISEFETILQTDDKESSAKKRNSKKLDAGDDTVSKLNLSGTVKESMNKSVTKTPKSEKKKTKRMSESQQEVSEATSNTDCVSLNSSKQEKPKKNEEDVEGSTTNKSLSKSSSASKKSKKISKSCDYADALGNTSDTIDETVNSKKRKRKSSLNQIENKSEVEETLSMTTSKNNLDTSVVMSRNKKRKFSHKMDKPETIDQALLTNIKMTVIKTQEQEVEKQPHQFENQIDNKTDNTAINMNTNKKGTKKRKEREDDEGVEMSKMLKVDTCNKSKVPRLPSSILNKLDDKPKKENVEFAKWKAVSTSNFSVEETKKKKLKPSNYLEESVYLNETEITESKKQKLIKNPKVLPFLPTASTSSRGYTTNFIVNILPKEIKFVAKSSQINNYKNDYLENKKNKRLGTYELYKRNRNLKMSKF